MNHLRIILTVIFIFSFPIFGDSVLYKNGKELKNVRTRIKKGLIQISFENGKTETVSKSEIQKVKFEATVWNSTSLTEKKITANKNPEIISQEESEEERLSEEAVNGKEWEERSEADKINPLGNAALGLIPGYSGLYRTKNNLGAVGFTAFELGLLASILKTNQDLDNLEKNSRKDEALTFATFLSLENQLAGTGWTTSGTVFLAYNYRLTVSEPQYKYDKGNLQSVRSAQLGALGLTLLLDAFFSYGSASEWNEGIYKGNSAPLKPTQPFSRLWRSAIIPGWGQYYAGEKSKGLGFMSLGGIGLLYGFYQDRQLKHHENLQKKENSPYGVSQNLTLLLVLQNPSALFSPFGISLFSSYNLTLKKLENERETEIARQNAISFLAVLWTYNLVDAYFFSGRNPDSDKQGKLTFQPTFQMNSVYNAGSWNLERNLGFLVQYNW